MIETNKIVITQDVKSTWACICEAPIFQYKCWLLLNSIYHIIKKKALFLFYHIFMNSPTLITNRLLPSNHIRSICQGLFFLFFSFKKFKNNNRSTKFMKFSNQIIKQFNYFLFFKIINGFLYSDSSPRKIANSNLLRINWIEALLARIEISTRFWLQFLSIK